MYKVQCQAVTQLIRMKRKLQVGVIWGAKMSFKLLVQSGLLSSPSFLEFQSEFVWSQYTFWNVLFFPPSLANKVGLLLYCTTFEYYYILFHNIHSVPVGPKAEFIYSTFLPSHKVQEQWIKITSYSPYRNFQRNSSDRHSEGRINNLQLNKARCIPRYCKLEKIYSAKNSYI